MGKKNLLISGCVVLILFKLLSTSSVDHRYLDMRQEEEELYSEGHYDSWNHKKPAYKDDEDYMEGYRDGKKYRPY